MEAETPQRSLAAFRPWRVISLPSSQFSGWKPVPLDPAGSSLLLRKEERA